MTTRHWLIPEPTRWLVPVALSLGLAALAVAYANVALEIFHTRTFLPGTKFVIEQAYAGLHAPSQIEGLALAYPPIPIIAFAVLGRPEVASTIFALAATLALVVLAAKSSDLVATVLLVLALLMPAVTTEALADATAWLFAAMLAWSMYLLVRYTEQEYSVYLFGAGLLIAFGSFIDLRIGAFAAVASVLLFVLYALKRQPYHGLSVIVAMVFPIVYFGAAWAFVTWVFERHGAVILPHLNLRPVLAAYPVAIASFIAAACVAISCRTTYRRFAFAIFLSLLVIVFVASISGLSFGAGEFSLLGLACAIAADTQIENVWLRRFAALVVLASAIALSFTLPALVPQTLNLRATETVAPPVITHAAWEGYLMAIRLTVAFLLAVGAVLLGLHSLKKLTGTTA
jgi:hypothetical protein